MSDIKINFDKVGKACRQVGEEWEKMMRENNPFDTVSKIAKDIADRHDREMALEFTKCIGELLKNNGVKPKIEEYKTGGVLKNDKILEEYYGVAITGLDFAEHDKRFRDEINQLNCDLNKTYNQLMEAEKEAQEKIKELETSKRNSGNYSMFLQTKVAELESELETKDNLLKIKNGLFGNFDELPSEPISVANMLINAKTECDLDTQYLVDKYSIDDLGQIAEHLLVYCKHNREDE